MANSSIGFKQNISASGVVDKTGACLIEFPPVAAGTIQTGSVTVYDSPITASWSVTINGIRTDTLQGQGTVGGVQIGHGDVLQVQTSGALTSIAKIFHATYTVVVTPADNTDLVAPGHDSLPLVNLASLIGTFVVPSGVINTQFTMPSGTSFIGVSCVPTATVGPQSTDILEIQGAVTNFIYLQTTIGQRTFFAVPINNDDTSVFVGYNNVGANPVAVSITAYPSNPITFPYTNVDIPVNVMVGTASTAVLVPAISAISIGTLFRCGTLTVLNTGAVATAGNAELQGTTSGINYAVFPAIIGAKAMVPIPCDAQVAEGLTVVNNSGQTLSVGSYYRAVVI